MQIFKVCFQFFAFLMELVLLFALGYWGFQQGKTSPWKYVFAFLIVAAAIAIWGTWMAPTSKLRLDTNYRVAAESVLFFIAAFMVYKTGHTSLALAFAVCICIREFIAFFFKW